MTSSELLASTPASAASGQYSLLVTRDPDEVRAAQRLRYDVFAGEMGATLPTEEPGIDVDPFDEFCDHIVARDDSTGAIVGTYRMLSPARAREAGKLYSDTEFDLSNLDALRAEMVEVGRSCVAPGHRNGAVMSLVWAGIAKYLLGAGGKYLVGCSSVPVADGGAEAAGVWDIVSAKHYAPEPYRVRPLHPFDVDSAPRPTRGRIPPLLRGYLRLGAWVCGPPMLDAEFGVADFFILFSMDNVDHRYVRFFLGDQLGDHSA
ncbi:GNAT family N-acetyltransferase [Sciscionella marina]|uniref:GNAT family N-acetyltransferase n=1 Tax=Sciscionella marina TaxID=508770 RepID=UPI0003740CB0|nr:GNAT family N-acyltransferase [Sciscionella marina]